MEPRHKALLVDGGMGLAWVVVGFTLADPSLVGRAWWLALAAAVVSAVGMYGSEHGLVGADATRQMAAYFVGFFGVVAAGVAVVMVTPLSLTEVIELGLGGLGVGLVCYRFVYGVVRPVPPGRLAGAERAV